MLRILTLLGITFFANNLQAQPSTEVYLFDLTIENGNAVISNPINVSNNEGYDNQPSFSANGKYLYYAEWQDDEQTDIIQYTIKKAEKLRVSNSDGSEYSPTPLPNGKAVSSILLERNGNQLLWKYDLKTKEATILVKDLVIGYHSWYDKNTLFSFVLGDTSTLQRSDLITNTNVVLDYNIGRSLHKIPGSDAISYVSKKDEEWRIIRHEAGNGSNSIIGKTLPKSEDMAWAGDNTIFMGSGNMLYLMTLDDKKWKPVKGFSETGLSDITRLAINSSSKKIAIVVSE